jgi:hypothetical protein
LEVTAMTALLHPPPTRFEHGDDLRALASARRDRVRFVDVPEKRFLAVDGHEVPGSVGFSGAIGALYSVAYPLHFALRARGVEGGRIGMLEGLYFLTPEELVADGPTAADAARDWTWRILLAVPDVATDDEVIAWIARAPAPFADRMSLDRWAEGPSAQILHVGSYGDEAPTLRRLHGAIAEAGLRPNGAHHEIYLNDPGRVGEDRAKTVLRQPVTAA